MLCSKPSLCFRLCVTVQFNGLFLPEIARLALFYNECPTQSDRKPFFYDAEISDKRFMEQKKHDYFFSAF